MMHRKLLAVLTFLCLAPVASASLVLGGWHGSFGYPTVGSTLDSGFTAYYGDSEVWGGLELVVPTSDGQPNAYYLDIEFVFDEVNPPIGGPTEYDNSEFTASGHWLMSILGSDEGAESVLIETGTFDFAGEVVPGPLEPSIFDPQLIFLITACADPGTVELPDGLGPIDFSEWMFTIDGSVVLNEGHSTFTVLADPKPGDVVPEPATVTLLAGGLGLLAYRRRRRP